MQIYLLPVLRDNYIFLLTDQSSGTAAVVDPAEAAPVLSKLQELRLDLVAIFNTHHHQDHVGGNRDLLKAYPHAQVYGSVQDLGRIPGQTVGLEAGKQVQFASQSAKVYFVPGHTRGHIAYYFQDSGDLFCGDTLFAGGCGRLFEGTPAQMVHSLDQLRHLPESTRVWCAHEYTLNNLRFALSIDGQNLDLRERLERTEQMRQRQEQTVPSTIAVERATNPFLRWDDTSLQKHAGSQNPIAVFTHIRAAKDHF